jgi:hypothetical protein
MHRTVRVLSCMAADRLGAASLLLAVCSSGLGQTPSQEASHARLHAVLDANKLSLRSGNIDEDGSIFLDLSGCAITNIAVLNTLPLKGLALADTQVRDLSGFKAPGLRYLDLRNTQVQDLSPVRNLPLRWLLINGTKVTDVAPLQECGLWRLSLSPGDGIKGLDSLRQHKTLRQMDSDVWHSLKPSTFLDQIRAHGQVTDYFEDNVRLDHPLAGWNRPCEGMAASTLFAGSQVERVLVLNHERLTIEEIKALVHAIPRLTTPLGSEYSTQSSARGGSLSAILLMNNGMTFLLEVERGSCRVTSPGGSMRVPLPAAIPSDNPKGNPECSLMVLPASSLRAGVLTGQPVSSVFGGSTIRQIIFPQLMTSEPLTPVVEAVLALQSSKQAMRDPESQTAAQNVLAQMTEIESLVLLANGRVVRVGYSRARCYVTTAEGTAFFRSNLNVPGPVMNRLFTAREFPNMSEFLKATGNARVEEPW